MYGLANHREHEGPDSSVTSNGIEEDHCGCGWSLVQVCHGRNGSCGLVQLECAKMGLDKMDHVAV